MWDVDVEDYKDYLKEHQKKKYEKLKAEGTLDKVAQEMVDKGEEQAQSLVEAMLKKNPKMHPMEAEMIAREMENEAMFQYNEYED